LFDLADDLQMKPPHDEIHNYFKMKQTPHDEIHSYFK